MSHNEYEYNDLEENKFKVKMNYKEKGKEYGVFNIQKSEFRFLMNAIELMSSSANISPKFSSKLEAYLIPRFNEILGIITMDKALPEQIAIEISKENQKEVLSGLSLPIIGIKLGTVNVSVDDLRKVLKEMKVVKYKN